jgi:hypothetical protein
MSKPTSAAQGQAVALFASLQRGDVLSICFAQSINFDSFSSLVGPSPPQANPSATTNHANGSSRRVSCGSLGMLLVTTISHQAAGLHLSIHSNAASQTGLSKTRRRTPKARARHQTSHLRHEVLA